MREPGFLGGPDTQRSHNAPRRRAPDSGWPSARARREAELCFRLLGPPLGKTEFLNCS